MRYEFLMIKLQEEKSYRVSCRIQLFEPTLRTTCRIELVESCVTGISQTGGLLWQLLKLISCRYVLFFKSSKIKILVKLKVKAVPSANTNLRCFIDISIMYLTRMVIIRKEIPIECSYLEKMIHVIVLPFLRILKRISIVKFYRLLKCYIILDFVMYILIFMLS